MKRSPFFGEIAACNPVLVGIQDREVANQFTTMEEEHRAVREWVGLLDWSTTGEFEVQGPDALAPVQKLIVNDASRIDVNRVLYTSILDKDGGMVSDITVYRLAPSHYMLMTAWGSNAAAERPEYERDIVKAAMPPGPAGEQRKGILIAMAGQNLDHMFDGAQLTFEFLMRSLQGEVYAELLYGGYDGQDAIRENVAAMSRVYEVGRRLAIGL